MSKTKAATADGIDTAGDGKSATVRGRVLLECAYGKPNDVVDVAVDLISSLVGVIDTDPDAVAYADSLKKE